MLSVAEADALLGQPVAGTETVPLDRVVDRVLSQPVVADRDGPPYDRVMMDGFAIRSEQGLRRWVVKGLQAAGHPALDHTEHASAIEVATGAILPAGCDAVVPYEHTKREGEFAVLDDQRPLPEAGVYVHKQGADYKSGEVLLKAGTRLRSPHLHCLATVGVDPVPVVRRPVWALAATGDELVEVRDEPQSWQIRRSNAAAIAGEARSWGLEPSRQAVLPDDKARLKAGLEKLLPGLDVLILTGGVSAGFLDLVPEVLAELGAETVFHGVAQRPGKPLWCGRLTRGGASTLIFGLPGNPVSSLFTFRRYVLPWLLAAEGRTQAEHRVKVSGVTAPASGFTVFLPWSEDAGVLDWKGSGDFLALSASTGFIEVGDERSLTEPRYYPWGGGR